MTRDEGNTGLRFVMVDTITEDACAKRAGAIDGRATVDDVVAFLAGLRLIAISENPDVTLDGYRGKYLEFTRTAGRDRLWLGRDGRLAGELADAPATSTTGCGSSTSMARPW